MDEDKERIRAQLHDELVQTVVNMGYPAEIGEAIAGQLGTEKTMSRMIGYLNRMQPASAEEIADEMLAICDDRDRWRKKKEAEFYNQKYNELIRGPLEACLVGRGGACGVQEQSAALQAGCYGTKPATTREGFTDDNDEDE